MDLERLERVYQQVALIPGIRSFLVARSGAVLREEYFNRGAPHLLNDVRSITKSYLSALVGIAIGRGLIRSVHDPISEYLASVVELDDDVGRVTIDDLLTMRAGHVWDVFAGTDFTEWSNAPDQVEHVLRRPIVDPPGTRWVYSDGTAHLMSAVLSEAAGMTALNFASQFLFGPLGVNHRPYWEGDFRGYNRGGVGLAVRTREILPFAMLYMNGGRHEGVQVIPEEWVKTSLHAHAVDIAEVVPASDDSAPFPEQFSYGYYWWLSRFAEVDFRFAQGYGGQFIVIVPSAKLVVVSTMDYWTLEGPQNWANASNVLRLIIGEVFPCAGIEP